VMPVIRAVLPEWASAGLWAGDDDDGAGTLVTVWKWDGQEAGQLGSEAGGGGRGVSGIVHRLIGPMA